MHWSYVFLALTHLYVNVSQESMKTDNITTTIHSTAKQITYLMGHTISYNEFEKSFKLILNDWIYKIYKRDTTMVISIKKKLIYIKRQYLIKFKWFKLNHIDSSPQQSIDIKLKQVLQLQGFHWYVITRLIICLFHFTLFRNIIIWEIYIKKVSGKGYLFRIFSHVTPAFREFMASEER